MTAAWEHLKATSSGAVAWRIVFDGIREQFVSLEEMEQAPASATDVERVSGLFTEGLKLAESADLVRAKWEPSGFKLRVLAEVGARVFHTDPTAITYLDQDRVTDADVSLAVTGAEAFGASGVFYMGTETFAYDSRTDLSFDSLTRGLWSIGGQAAQYHYRSSEVVSDDRLSVPEIADRPAVFEGRRVYAYVYAPGDDLQGDGTRVWAGVCSTEPTTDGEYWSWTVDPLSRIFAWSLASDLADEFGLRGAYYSEQSPLTITIREWDTSNVPVEGTHNVTNEASVKIIGLFDNRAEFVDAVTHILDLATSSWSGWSVAGTGGVVAEARGDSWGLAYTTPVSPQWIELRVDSIVDGVGVDRAIARAGVGSPWVGTRGGEGSVFPSARYLSLYTQPDGTFDLFAPGGGGTFPRTSFGASRAGGAREVGADRGGTPYTYETSDGLFDAGNVSSGWDGYALDWDRLALSAPVTTVAGRTALSFEWEELDPAPEAIYAGRPFDGMGSVIAERPGVVAPDGAPRVSLGSPLALIATAANAPTFQVVREWVRSGNVADFIQQLLDDRAEFLNLGLAPDLRADDFEAGWDADLRETASRASLLNQRQYVAATATDLLEFLEQELRLLGCYAHFSVEGRIRFREVKPPSDVEVLDATIDVDQLVTAGGWFKYEPAQIGIFNQVVHSTGYDPLEDEHLGDPWDFKWQAGYTRVPGGRTLEVKPKSVDPPRQPEHDAQRTIGAHRILATFGERYAVLTVGVLFELFDAVVGDVVSVTWSKLPNAAGGFGATVTVRVTGRSWAPDDAYGTLTLLLSRVRYGGYAPGARCESIAGTSGGVGPFTVTVDLPSYFPADTDLTDFMEVGDEIEVYRWGHRVADRHDATVSAVTASSLSFTTTTAWAHAGYTWAWGARKATSYTQDQNLAEFAFEANASSRIDFADAPVPRLVFAP